MHHCQKSPDSFPLLSSPESTVIEVFLVSVFHACPQFSFVVPTVECVRGYDIDLTIVILNFPNDVCSLMITRKILGILVIKLQKCFVFSLA